MKEKKLLYISNRVFWPPMGGHEVEVYHYCRGLRETYGYTIDVYAFDSIDKIEGVNKPTFLNDVILAKPIGYVTKLMNIISKSFFCKEQWPLQNSLYYSKENEDAIKFLIADKKYDVVIVDMIRLAPYYSAFQNFDCKKILDIDDTLSKRYERQLNALTDNTNIAGQYHGKLPRFIQRLISLPILKKVVLRLEIPRMRRTEEYYSRIYDNVIFVSSLETEEFNTKYKTDKAVTVSLGVDYPYFSKDVGAEKVQGRVTFVGNMATPANADSLRMIISDVLPHSKNITELLVVGGCPKELLDEFKDNSKVQFTGRVDDLRAYVASGMVFLAPIAYGTGIKTKILEAMAMRLPVVTNSIGAEGIHAEQGKHWYVSDDGKKIAQYMDALLESQLECDRIGDEAQLYVKEFFQWEFVFEQFKRLGL